ncbi:uncharacterized protein F5891DRAFT_972800, partial [Suillus fuscotomentosus]
LCHLHNVSTLIVINSSSLILPTNALLHVFSASNKLAWSTRHATVFHHHQTIEEHFAFWDVDKYVSLITNFYVLRQFLMESLLKSSIHTLMAELSALKVNLGLTDANFIQFHSEEQLYLDNLKALPPKELLQIHCR